MIKSLSLFLFLFSSYLVVSILFFTICDFNNISFLVGLVGTISWVTWWDGIGVAFVVPLRK